MIKLVPIEAVHASDYNPRKNDEKRLNITELSLRKLGFLLPIYADKSGEILSGHQRHIVATRMGFKHIPVSYVDETDINERKTMNVLFNRATNDMAKTDNVAKIKNKLYSKDIEGMAAALPDITPDSEASYPCVNQTKRVDTMQLAKKNHRNFDSNICALQKALGKKTKDTMPIIITPNMEVVNGIGRLQAAVEAKKKIVICVEIPETHKEFAYAMLNLLSMDFSMESQYADTLRFNSFMRTRNTRETDAYGNCAFGDGFFKGLWSNRTGRELFKLQGKDLQEWIEHYGDKIVDFGAGKLNNTRTLRNAGVYCSAFEPYFVTAGDKIHKEKSIEIGERFLQEIASGIKYTSVFISSVFNSVPFMEDRKKIAVIAAALCYPAGQTICWCQSNNSATFAHTKIKLINLHEKGSMVFDLDYEPNTTLGDLSKHPKVQKGHLKEELVDIFSRCFKTIKRIDCIGTFWYVEAVDPIINLELLAEAIDFEFNLPYPDGTNAGLSEKARAAFEKRLNIKLPKGGDKQ